MTAGPSLPVTVDGEAARTPGPGLRAMAARFWLEVLMRMSHRVPRLTGILRGPVVSVAWMCSPALRDGPMANAARILGPSSSSSQRRALARRVVANFYDFVCDFGRNRARSAPELCALAESVEGVDHFRRARAMKRGAIVVTAHLGSFELGAAMLASFERRLHVVFRRDQLPSFDRLRSEYRRRLGVTEAPLDEGWGVWLRLRDALIADEVVMLQGDRTMPGQPGVAVPFLDGHIDIPSGPVKLAMASGAPILPVFTTRTGSGRFCVVIDEPIVVEREPARTDGPHPALLRIAAAIERQVARHPEQWLMLHRVWREDRHASP
jgi:KDO2-lipid IV(A) lauroyltransferase